MQHEPNAPAWAARPFSEVLRLSWPTVISLLSLSLMTFVDTVFIGRLGSLELAAAGLGGVCTFTVLSFGMSIFSAAKVKVGERKGRGDAAGVDRALGAFLRLSLWLGLLSTFFGLAAAASLPFVSGDFETGKLAGQYAGIRALGFPIVLVGSAVAQWLQAQGDTKSAMRAALIANVANAPLNALLIFGFQWGIVGAAIATASSRLIETGYLVHLQRSGRVSLGAQAPTRHGLHWEKSSWSDSMQTLWIGLPTGLERVLDMLAFAAVPLLLAQVHPLEVAAHQIVLQVLLLSFLPLIALSDSVSILISQAMGARFFGLVSKVRYGGLALALGYGVFCGVVFVGLGPALTGVFTTETKLARLAQETLVVGAVLQLINAPYVLLKGVLRGQSDFRFVACVTVGCSWLLTPPLTYWWGVRSGYGAPGAWAALCAEVSVGVLLCGIRARPQARSVPAAVAN